MKWLWAFLGLAFAVTVTGLNFFWSDFKGEDRPVIDIEKKHPNDKRLYRSITLNNQLEVLIISDPDLNKSAAAMDVAVGSLEDPEDHLGLAHFLEHMLFLGTEKYPDIEEYSRYLHSFQGSSNAYTAGENTNYHFEINHEGFEGAMERFAQFFISPTLDPRYIERERNAVHSEHQKNLQDDYWRARMILRGLHKDGHPRQKFSTGDQSTLSQADQKILKEFYKKYYSANQMKLAIMTPLGPEEAEQIVSKYFSDIPNQNRGDIKYDSDIFDPKDLPRTIYIKSVKDLKKMTLLFSAPSKDGFWESKPGGTISHLIGHEGKGSLLSILKKDNLATGLSAWLEPGSYASMFHFEISLTEHGMKNTNAVLEDFFEYVNLLKKEGLKRYIYDERKIMGDVNYVYRDHREGSYTAASYAARMHLHPGEEIDKRDMLLHKFSPKDYELFLSYIKPENLNLMIQGNELETNQTEKFYGTEYRVEKISDDVLDKLKQLSLDSRFALPVPNDFIPKKLELLSSKTKTEPAKLIDDDRGVFWFQLDDQFLLPKANIQLLLLNRSTNDTPEHKAMSILYSMALNESLNEWNYDISLAGLHYSMARTDRGIQLDVSGYSERIPYLIQSLAKKLTSISILPEQFEALKTELKNNISNARLDVAYQQLIYELKFLSAKNLIHRDNIYNPDKKVDLISDITLDHVQAYANELYKTFAMEGSAYGSLDQTEIKKSIDSLFDIFKPVILAKKERPETEMIKFQHGQPMARVLDTESLNHCWGMNLQFGKRNPALNAAIRIGHAYLKTSFFTELRTKQQLGYVVFSGLNHHEKGLGMLFLIQSSEYDPFEIEKRVQEWKVAALKELQDMSEEQIESFKSAVAKELREKDQTMAEKHQTNIFETLIMDGQFNYKEKIAVEAEKMTKEKVVEVFANAFNSSLESSLTVYLASDKEKVKPATRGFIIENIDVYKKSANLY